MLHVYIFGFDIIFNIEKVHVKMHIILFYNSWFYKSEILKKCHL